MSDLAAFLAARLDEDEAIANAAMEAVREPYQVDALDLELHPADTAHYSRHNAARVLREVEAKRRILAEHLQLNTGMCRMCIVVAPCYTVRVLAGVYAGHPDYDEAWK